MSKLAPISQFAEGVLAALEGQDSGFMWDVTKSDGSVAQMSEGQIVGVVLKELRGLVQLVIGYAATADDLRAFLSANNIAP